MPSVDHAGDDADKDNDMIMHMLVILAMMKSMVIVLRMPLLMLCLVDGLAKGEHCVAMVVIGIVQSVVLTAKSRAFSQRSCCPALAPDWILLSRCRRAMLQGRLRSARS